MAVINGELINDADGTTVSEYLEKKNYTQSRVAVEINGYILPKNKFSDTVISKTDKIEIVAFVGGG